MTRKSDVEFWKRINEADYIILALTSGDEKLEALGLEKAVEYMSKYADERGNDAY